MDRADIVHENFLRRVGGRDFPAGRAPSGPLTAPDAVAIYRAACLSRALDRTSRAMQRAGQGFYTIGSSGHEGMAAVAAALRPTDMAFLHYRDAAFQIARGGQVPGQTMAWDMLLSFAASAEDPISGGRHKVLGSRALMIPPQTSTIASHLPKAVGAAFSIGIARRMGFEDTVLAKDGVVLCSFGDASTNHSTAVGALNTAAWAAFQGTPMPIVFLCEDNGIGISTRTPMGWIEANWSGRAGLHYIACDGCDLADAWRGASEAVEFARRYRKPVFLHMKTVRLYGHAGNDVQQVYLSKDEIAADNARDPLLASAALLIEEGVMTAADVRREYDAIEAQLLRQVELAILRPKLPDAAAVMASIVPPKREGASRPLASAEARAALKLLDFKTVLFLLTMLLAGMVLSNLVEEKGNKIIEILAAAIPMDAVFLGKLFAMLAVSWVGISVWGLMGGAVWLTAGHSHADYPAPAVGWAAFLGLGVVYFSMGYLLLGSIFLAIGSLASTVREVQTLSMPVTMLQLLNFFFASFAMAMAGTWVETVAMIIPFSSPFMMLAKAAQHEGLWIHAVVIAWQGFCVVLLVRAGARMFKRRVMQSGPAGASKRGFFRRRAAAWRSASARAASAVSCTRA